ncbi:MAG: hypothetical protein LBG60_15075 [Bifidobacteriaceae bacterium]|nr:hypothetical protein [Bifidobacteriaceae bacterium]
MGLVEDAAVPPVPAEWMARQVIRGDEAEIVTGPMKPVETDAELLRQFGYDPDEIEIVGTINQWRKQQPDGSWIVSYYFRSRPRREALDLPALYAAAREAVMRHECPAARPPRVTVVALADAQIGKTGSRGGTAELLERLTVKRGALDRELLRRGPAWTLILDVGDLVENFESGGNPQFTNDLSLAQQLDCAATEVYEFVRVAAKHGPVVVAAVPSNHGAWRRGKTELGKPGDDFGLFVHQQVRKVAEAAGIDARWVFPPKHDEAVTVEAVGTVVGVVHGHRSRPGRLIDWWAKQQHGGQPVGAADVLVTGHYHHLVVQPTGRNPHTSRTRWWLQCPTLDNGSDWFRNRLGEDSDPGLLVFDVTEDHGFDLQSLTVL